LFLQGLLQQKFTFTVRLLCFSFLITLSTSSITGIALEVLLPPGNSFKYPCHASQNDRKGKGFAFKTLGAALTIQRSAAAAEFAAAVDFVKL